MHTLKMKKEAVYKCIRNSTRLPAVSQIKILGAKDSILFAFNTWYQAGASCTVRLLYTRDPLLQIKSICSTRMIRRM